MVTFRQLRQMKSRELPDIVSMAHSILLRPKPQGVILTRDSQPVGFVTRHDVINFTDEQQ